MFRQSHNAARFAHLFSVGRGRTFVCISPRREFSQPANTDCDGDRPFDDQRCTETYVQPPEKAARVRWLAGVAGQRLLNDNSAEACMDPVSVFTSKNPVDGANLRALGVGDAVPVAKNGLWWVVRRFCFRNDRRVPFADVDWLDVFHFCHVGFLSVV